jgi:hypothetical protein
MVLEVGHRISWQVVGDKIVGQRLPSVIELAGCLKDTSIKGPRKGIKSAFGRAAIARYERVNRQTRG